MFNFLKSRYNRGHKLLRLKMAKKQQQKTLPRSMLQKQCPDGALAEKSNINRKEGCRKM